MVRVGDIARKRHLFTAENIAQVALALGDNNPAHHDPVMAAGTRFGGIIAAAGHSTGVFVSLLAEHFTQDHQAYGLEFNYKLKKAVPAGLDAVLEWRVVAIEPAHKLGGEIVKLEGELKGVDGRVFIEGRGALLVLPKGTP